MKYAFKDIYNEEMYETAQVIIVAGQYNIFNNIVVDRLKDMCKPQDELEINKELFNEFGVDTTELTADNKSNSVDFDTFMDIVGTPNINGKWFCSVDISMLKKSQLNLVDNYIKAPNKNGVLVIVAHEYREFMRYLKYKALQLSKNAHIIQLGFPNRKLLTEIVINLFAKREVTIDEKSADLFVMRLSSAYDDYDSVINKITMGYNGAELSYETVEEGLKGINNFMLDDFIEALLKPIGTDKIKGNRKIYKMYKSLIKDMGADKLIRELKKKVDVYLEFRMAINNGIIPVSIRYSVAEAKGKLGKDSPIANIVDFRFRKLAYTASLTSLKDWVYIKMLLNDSDIRNNQHNEKVLYALMHRTAFNQERLNNDIKIENVLNNQIEMLDSIRYTK